MVQKILERKLTSLADLGLLHPTDDTPGPFPAAIFFSIILKLRSSLQKLEFRKKSQIFI